MPATAVAWRSERPGSRAYGPRGSCLGSAGGTKDGGTGEPGAVAAAPKLGGCPALSPQNYRRRRPGGGPSSGLSSWPRYGRTATTPCCGRSRRRSPIKRLTRSASTTSATRLPGFLRSAALLPAGSAAKSSTSATTGGVPRESWELLLWVLTCGGVRLRSRKKEDVPELSGDSAVDAVFEVERSPQADRRFEATRGDREVFFAYHGSRLDNFHSILHNGLLTHMNKNALFGSGTYLSSELSVSATFSPAGYGWQHSIVSPELSCVAMCEVIDHPDVKCQDRARSKPSRAFARDSMAGMVPERYYLVQNDSVVRVKYLLVYTAARPPPAPEILPAGMMMTVDRAYYSPGWQDFLRKNKSWLMVAAYAALLCGIGLSSSRVGHKLMLKLFYR
ncbi:hypothetical protein MRX96_045820 [Rhipicephalus microplus]